MTAVDTTPEALRLADTADTVILDATRPAAMREIKDALNGAGLVRARKMLNGALDIVERARNDVRVAQEGERAAREELDEAVAEAEWLLSARFVTEGNKTYLVDVPPGEDRRSMTADERKAWLAREARSNPEVRALADILRRAEAVTLERRDTLASATERLQAARHDLDAARVQTELLSYALPRQVAHIDTAHGTA